MRPYVLALYRTDTPGPATTFVLRVRDVRVVALLMDPRPDDWIPVVDHGRGYVYAVGAPVQPNPFAPRPCELLGPIDDEDRPGPVADGPVTSWDRRSLLAAFERERRETTD